MKFKLNFQRANHPVDTYACVGLVVLSLNDDLNGNKVCSSQWNIKHSTLTSNYEILILTLLKETFFLQNNFNSFINS